MGTQYIAQQMLNTTVAMITVTVTKLRRLQSTNVYQSLSKHLWGFAYVRHWFKYQHTTVDRQDPCSAGAYFLMQLDTKQMNDQKNDW